VADSGGKANALSAAIVRIMDVTDVFITIYFCVVVVGRSETPRGCTALACGRAGAITAPHGGHRGVSVEVWKVVRVYLDR
jgi:hypothetical protein